MASKDVPSGWAASKLIDHLAAERERLMGCAALAAAGGVSASGGFSPMAREPAFAAAVREQLAAVEAELARHAGGFARAA